MMRKIFAAAMLIFAAVGLVAAQTNNAQVEQELRKLNREMFDASLKGDKKVFERVLVDNYAETGSSGNYRTRAQVLSGIQKPPASVKLTYKIDDVQVRVFGDTAVMTYRDATEAEVAGQKIPESRRMTDIFVKQNGQWRLVAAHGSEIPPERVAAKVDPKIFDAYVGEYEIAPDIIIVVLREGDKLFEHSKSQPQEKTELLAENETTFHPKGSSNNPGVFVKDEKGQVTHLLIRMPGGQEIKAKKIK